MTVLLYDWLFCFGYDFIIGPNGNNVIDQINTGVDGHTDYDRNHKIHMQKPGQRRKCDSAVRNAGDERQSKDEQHLLGNAL